ncbi:MAG: hypothetical protein LBB75_01360 [Oscillospiraceae bacterium]|nr:hypothetical protein [Oscillospiraceae bacterium]
MKKTLIFVLAICLLALAVMAVLSVTYPELQQGFRDFFADAWARVGTFFRLFFEPFKQAFGRR